jgi:hypothetical protein
VSVAQPNATSNYGPNQVSSMTSERATIGLLCAVTMFALAVAFAGFRIWEAASGR